MKATWNNTVLAGSDDTIVVEGNHYFPPESIKKELFKLSRTHSKCPWKGEASYYSIEAAGKENTDAAWFYAEPREAAENIKDYVAFWKGVQITS